MTLKRNVPSCSHNLGLIGLGKQITDIVKDARISRWNGWPNWTLVSINQTLDILDSCHNLCLPGFSTISISSWAIFSARIPLTKSISRTRNTSDCSQLFQVESLADTCPVISSLLTSNENDHTLRRSEGEVILPDECAR